MSRLVHRLVAMAPARFRTRFGEEVEILADDQLREDGREVGVAADVALAVAREWWEEMMKTKMAAVVGSILVFPSLIFVTRNVAHYFLGFESFLDFTDAVLWPRAQALQVGRDTAVLFGPVAAVFLTGRVAWATRKAGATLTAAWPLWAVLSLGLALIGIMGFYLVVENWDCITGAQERC